MANYSYSHLEITRSHTAGEKGNQPGNTPEQLASLWSQYTVQSGALSGLAIGGGVRYVGPSYIDSQNQRRHPPLHAV